MNFTNITIPTVPTTREMDLTSCICETNLVYEQLTQRMFYLALLLFIIYFIMRITKFQVIKPSISTLLGLKKPEYKLINIEIFLSISFFISSLIFALILNINIHTSNNNVALGFNLILLLIVVFSIVTTMIKTILYLYKMDIIKL